MGVCMGKEGGGGKPGVHGGRSKPAENRNAPSNSSSSTATVQRATDGSAIPNFGLQGLYELKEKLGKGGTGETWLCTNLATQEKVAVKFIRRPILKMLLKQIQREITIQADLGEGHVNVIKAKEVILTNSHLALAMECAFRGSLTKYVAARWTHAQSTGLFLSEDEARYVFHQFISAVEYCHAQKVAHRDLKLDNTLLDGSNPPRIKLCDFGFANQWATEGSQMTTHLGTPAYMSPELLSSVKDGSVLSYDAKSVDVWAAGVTLIVMLMGAFPFDHAENLDPNSPQAQYEVWMQQIGTSWNEIPQIKSGISKLTPECCDLLNKIFVVSSAERITVEQIKEHPWYNMPLSEKFAKAEADIAVEQAERDQLRANRRISEALKQQRTMRLGEMVKKAGERAPPGVPNVPERIDLTEAAISEPAGLGGIGEEK